MSRDKDKSKKDAEGDNLSRMRKIMETELRGRAFEALKEAESLKAEAERYYEEVMDYSDKYFGDDRDGNREEGSESDIGWEDKDRIYKEAEELWKKMEACTERLFELDAVYEELMKEVNEFYGREVLKRGGNMEMFKKLLLEMDAEEDFWWKKEDGEDDT